MKKFITILFLCVYIATNSLAQKVSQHTPELAHDASLSDFTSACDSLCQAQQLIEQQRNELEAKLRYLDYEKAKIKQSQKDKVHIKYEAESNEYLQNIANIEYNKNLCIANCIKQAAIDTAAQTTKFKSRWEVTFQDDVLRTCNAVCPPSR